MSDTVTSIFNIVILIFSVVVHEVSHGYAALWYGDQTAKIGGRLTLNPLKHIDPMGSIVVPALLILSHAPFPFGWARPVPYNENNLSNRKIGTLVVASAGILVNFAIACIFGLLLRLCISFGFINDGFLYATSIIVLINIGLAVFNSIPVPPLDGSKILFNLLPYQFRPIQNFLERNAFVVILIFMVFLWKFDFISPLMQWLFTFITGVRI